MLTAANEMAWRRAHGIHRAPTQDQLRQRVEEEVSVWAVPKLTQRLNKIRFHDWAGYFQSDLQGEVNRDEEEWMLELAEKERASAGHGGTKRKRVTDLTDI